LRKIFALYRNELEKTFHRATTWLLLGLMVVSTFGVGALLRLGIKITESYTFGGLHINSQGEEVDADTYYSQLLEEETASLRSSLETEKARLHPDGTLKETFDGESGMGAADVYSSIASMEASLFLMEFAQKHGLDYYNYRFYVDAFLEEDYDFRGEILVIMRTFADTYYLLETNRQYRSLELHEAAQYALAKQALEQCDKIALSGDYQAWLDLQVSAVSLLAGDEGSKQAMLAQYELLRKANPDGKTNPALIYPVIADITTLERSLADDVEYDDAGGGNATPLTDKRRAELENKLAIANYRLDHRYFSVDSALRRLLGVSIPSYDLMKQTGQSLLVILVLILAGSTIAQEIATGSIKALIIAPVRRRKILVAKALSIFTVAVAGSVVLFGVLMAGEAAFFRSELHQPFVYAAEGVAHALPFGFYRAAELAVDLLPILNWLSFALMLSTLLRNTAAAVGISLGGYFLSNTLGQVLQMLPQSWALRFIPMLHYDLGASVFSSGESQSAMLAELLSGGGDSSGTISAGFSACYLAVLVFCFGLTAYDSFCKKDLK
jgi:ABC-2 type transport system permease protein